MGIFKKRGGQQKFTFVLHVHTLSPLKAGSLCVSFERGSHSGATRAAEASANATYAWEQQLQLPATLYEDAAGARKGSGKGLVPFEPKHLKLAVVPADRSGKPAGAPLGTITLNLADYAAADGRTQQSFSVVGAGGRGLAGAPKLLLTIGCRDASHSRAGGPLVIEPSQSSNLELEGIPTTMSTDEEGSRPSSRGDSRSGSRAEAAAAARGLNGALPAVPEEAAASGRAGGAGAAANGRRQQAVGAAAASGASPPLQQPRHASPAGLRQQQLEQEASGLHDEDGFLLDASVDAEVSLEQSGSVRRNLGSAMERAEPSVEVASRAPSEVQSRLSSSQQAAALAAAGAAAGAAAARAAPHVSVPATPADAAPGQLLSPQPASTGQQSTFSAAGDPAVPFTVPASTHRRFAQRDDGGASRRWAWRREGGGAATASGSGSSGGGGSIFQRARIASVSKQESSDGSATAAGGGVEASAHSGPAGSGVFSRGTEPSTRRTTSEDQAAAGQQQHHHQQHVSVPLTSARQASSAAGPFAAAAASAFDSQPAATGPRRGSTDAGAAAASGAPRQRSLLRPAGASSLFDSLVAASSIDQLPSSASPYTNSLVVEALMRELRILAALESAVYLACGRKAFSGGNRQLHAPARRLARTIIALGPQEGLGFGLQAICAIEAAAGAASGDTHRLTHWWSNVLQLRWMFWTLCQGQGHGPDPQQAAATGGSWGSGMGAARGHDGLGRQSSEYLSPRAATTAAAGSAGWASAAGLDWMQVLLPQLRELESWLFSEMLKHLWWRVLLQGVTAQLPNSSFSSGGSSASGASSAAAAPAAGGGFFAAATAVAAGAKGVMRAARSAPFLAAARQQSEDAESLQGMARSFETPEEEAVQHWVGGLAAVQRALTDPSRPPPAPRAHLALLHRQLIVALLHRLDTLLFRKLLLEEGEAPLCPPSMTGMSGGGRDLFNRSADADDVLGGGAEALLGLLDQGLLPFQRGPVTFGTGVSLKMAVSRLNSWAADCGVKEERMPQAARSTEMSDYRLFPCLRATADLLMMPKEVLTDRQMRREVVPGLPLHRVCQLLERFEPDDCAPDPLPPGLLEALQSESPHSDGGSTPSPTAKAEEEYMPPAEAILLADGVIEPLSLEMDEESDEELESLAGQYRQSGAELATAGSGAMLASMASGGTGDELRSHRFVLLKDLWATAL